MRRDLPDLESIACFLAAARTLNFRAAAKTVALTPAAFGKRIKQLEMLLECQLFERTTRHVTLTPHGEAMISEARALIRAAERCVHAGRGHTGPAPLRINIGTRYELGLSWLLPMLPKLEAELPHIEFNYYFGSGPDLEERIRRFDVQCAVSSRVFVDPIFDSTRLVEETYVFVGSTSLLASTPFTAPQHAVDHCLIDAHEEQPLYRYFRDANEAPPSLPFGQFRIMGTISAIRAMLLADRGVAVLPYYLVKPDLDGGCLQRIFPNVRLRTDYFRLMFRRDDPNRSVYAELANIIRTQPLT